jgi:hypothetical protein
MSPQQLRAVLHRIAMNEARKHRKEGTLPEPATAEHTVDRDNRLAKIFNEHFVRLGLAPDWQQASIKYRMAVIAGVRAVLKDIGIK